MKLYRLITIILAIGYGLQLFTPIRLQYDSVTLLSVADSVAHGGSYLFQGQPTVFPPGYPSIIAVFLRFGLSYTMILVALNLVFIVAGLFAAFRLFKNQWPFGKVPTAICIFTAFSFIFIRHATIAATDLCFFGVSIWTLLVLRSISESHLGRALVLRIIASWVMAVAAISVRRVGLALVPALIWSLASHPEIKNYIRRCSIRGKTTAVVTILFLACITVFIVKTTSTIRDRHADSAMFNNERQIITCRLGELAQLAFNAVGYTDLDEGRGYVASVKLPKGLDSILPGIGGLIVGIVLFGISKTKFTSTEVYVLSYLAIIFAWPYYDTRFWLPVIPFVIGYSVVTLKQVSGKRISRKLVYAYSYVFCGIGLWWLVASTSITFSGRNFPNVYLEGYYHLTYCDFYHSCTPTSKSFPTFPVNQAALHLLQTYK